MQITNTPNVGLQIPSYNVGNWQVPLDYDLSLLDLLLSGGASVPNLLLAGALYLAANPTTPADTGIYRTAPGVLALGNGTAGNATAQVHAGSFYGDGSHLTGINGISAQAQGVAIGSFTALNFTTNLNAWLVGSTVTVTAAFPVSTPGWTKFLITMSAGNWYVNGFSVAAIATSGTSQFIPLYTTALRTVFHSLILKTSTAFLPTAVTTNVTLGTAATPDALMMVSGDSYNPTAAVSATNLYLAGGIHVVSFGADPIGITITTATTPSVLTAGALEVDVLTSVLP